MILSELSLSEILSRLRHEGLVVRCGPFCFRLRSRIESVVEGLRLLYADYPVVDATEFADFTVTLDHSTGLRRFWRPQVTFVYDGENPFVPLPVDHAFPLLEWAMNWCISTQAHNYLTLHAAVIERDDCAVIMPAPPGSGKSTLCAGLVNRGWRLLSDELALVSLEDGSISPLCRPVSLKNQSLDVIRRFAPEAVFNAVTHDTSKGSVSHMKVRPNHLALMDRSANPKWIIFPKYSRGAPATLQNRSRADSMLELGRNSFNYPILGLQGFELLADVVSECDCHDFTYSELDDAVSTFDGLVRQRSG